jgi:hypothetical protein
MEQTHAFTLAYNYSDIVEDAVSLMRTQNKGEYNHTIIDPGFPLNTDDLSVIATKYNSEYRQIDNIGVSQNWNQVIDIIKPNDNDTLIGVEPDERPLDNDWINAMNKVLSIDNMAMCALMIDDHIQYADSWEAELKSKEGIEYYEMHGVVNIALIGLSGKFVNHIKEIPIPEQASRYGYIEWALWEKIQELGYNWAILKDYRVHHLFGDGLYREWKEYCFSTKDQLSFDEWMEIKK